MSGKRLPLDLCLEFIGHLWDDHPALSACSLTCHDWFPTARSHLFHTVSLNCWNSQRFASLVGASEAASTGVTSCIRDLTLDNLGHGVDDTSLCSVLPKLQKVETLRLRGVLWLALPDATRAVILASFPALTTLHLRTIYIQEVNELFVFFGSYPRLSSVHLASVTVVTAQTPPRAVLPPARRPGLDFQAPQIGELSMQDWIGSVATVVTDWFFQHPPNSLTCIRKIKWDCLLAQHNTAALYRWLHDEHVVATLEHLSLTFFWGLENLASENLDDCLSFDLSRLTRLTTLEIQWPLTPTTANPSWIPASISKISSVYLRHITFLLYVGQGEIHLHHVAWKHVDEALAALGHSHPEMAVTFKFSVHPGEQRTGVEDGGLKSAVFARLPDLVASGLQVRVLRDSVSFKQSAGRFIHEMR